MITERAFTCSIEKKTKMAMKGITYRNPSSQNNKCGPNCLSPTKAFRQEFCMGTQLNISEVSHEQENHFETHFLFSKAGTTNQSPFPVSRHGCYFITNKQTKESTQLVPPK